MGGAPPAYVVVPRRRVVGVRHIRLRVRFADEDAILLIAMALVTDAQGMSPRVTLLIRCDLRGYGRKSGTHLLKVMGSTEVYTEFYTVRRWW